MSEQNLGLIKQEPQESNRNIVVKQPTFEEFYNNISKEKFDDKSITILQADVDENDVEIRPDGLIYLPEIKYRRILNKAFGAGAWSLIQMNTIIDEQNSVVYYDGALFIQGRYHARATGEMRYIEKNQQMTWATALEGAKSDCLTRCCKDLGVASELWDKQFINKWLEKHAVKVWCTNQKTSEKKPLWRKKTEKPIDIYPWKEQNGNAQPPNSNGEKTDKQLLAKQIYVGNMLMALTNQNKEKASELLIEYSKSKDEKYKPFSSVKDIKSVKQAEFLIGKIEKDNEQYDWIEFKNSGKLVEIPNVEEMFETEKKPNE